MSLKKERALVRDWFTTLDSYTQQSLAVDNANAQIGCDSATEHEDLAQALVTYHREQVKHDNAALALAAFFALPLFVVERLASDALEEFDINPESIGWCRELKLIYRAARALRLELRIAAAADVATLGSVYGVRDELADSILVTRAAALRAVT